VLFLVLLLWDLFARSLFYSFASILKRSALAALTSVTAGVTAGFRMDSYKLG
jgi:hypothetical protein